MEIAIGNGNTLSTYENGVIAVRNNRTGVMVSTGRDGEGYTYHVPADTYAKSGLHGSTFDTCEFIHGPCHCDGSSFGKRDVLELCDIAASYSRGLVLK